MCASINSRRHGVARGATRTHCLGWCSPPSGDRGQTTPAKPRAASKFRLQMDSGDGDEGTQWALTKSMRNLVDLVRFEPSTSSMPFKKYQSLTGRNDGNTRLSLSRRGRRWMPRASFLASGLHADSGTPHRGLACGVLSRARGCKAVVIVVCWSRQQFDFPIRRMPGVSLPQCGVFGFRREWPPAQSTSLKRSLSSRALPVHASWAALASISDLVDRNTP
jgi:hypothetical protein